jgi:hypothetical protein
MTIPGFGRLTPIQIHMLELAGINLNCHLYGFDPSRPGTEAIPDDDRIQIMKRGRDSLMKATGEDFGYDLEAWRKFLVSHPELGYTHPYGSKATTRHVLSAIADPERRRLSSMIEESTEAAPQPGLRESQIGTVVEWLKPFSFKVRLQTGEVLICGLVRSYFGRTTPSQAVARLEAQGPHPGDEVTVLISENRAGGMRQGVILNPRHS